MDFNDLFRIVTGVVLLVAWYVVSRRTRERWANMTRVGKRLWLGYYSLLFAILWATIEQLHSDAAITSKNYVLLLAAFALMLGALLRLEGDESTEPVYRVHTKGSPTQWSIQKLR